MRYTADNSGRKGEAVHVDLAVSFFPGISTVHVEDRGAYSIRQLANRRFNYQALDSPVDLLARDKWRSWWFGRFTGAAYLQRPRISGVPLELSLALIISRVPAFAVVEFRLDDTCYQLACRPPRGVNSWTRLRLTEAGKTVAEEDFDSPPLTSLQADRPSRRLRKFPRYRHHRQLGGKSS